MNLVPGAFAREQCGRNSHVSGCCGIRGGEDEEEEDLTVGPRNGNE